MSSNSHLQDQKQQSLNSSLESSESSLSTSSSVKRRSSLVVNLSSTKKRSSITQLFHHQQRQRQQQYASSNLRQPSADYFLGHWPLNSGGGGGGGGSCSGGVLSSAAPASRLDDLRQKLASERDPFEAHRRAAAASTSISVTRHSTKEVEPVAYWRRPSSGRSSSPQSAPPNLLPSRGNFYSLSGNSFAGVQVPSQQQKQQQQEYLSTQTILPESVDRQHQLELKTNQISHCPLNPMQAVQVYSNRNNNSPRINKSPEPIIELPRTSSSSSSSSSLCSADTGAVSSRASSADSSHRSAGGNSSDCNEKDKDKQQREQLTSTSSSRIIRRRTVRRSYRAHQQHHQQQDQTAEENKGEEDKSGKTTTTCSGSETCVLQQHPPREATEREEETATTTRSSRQATVVQEKQSSHFRTRQPLGTGSTCYNQQQQHQSSSSRQQHLQSSTSSSKIAKTITQTNKKSIRTHESTSSTSRSSTTKKSDTIEETDEKPERGNQRGAMMVGLGRLEQSGVSPDSGGGAVATFEQHRAEKREEEEEESRSVRHLTGAAISSSSTSRHHHHHLRHHHEQHLHQAAASSTSGGADTTGATPAGATIGSVTAASSRSSHFETKSSSSSSSSSMFISSGHQRSDRGQLNSFQPHYLRQPPVAAPSIGRPLPRASFLNCVSDNSIITSSPDVRTLVYEIGTDFAELENALSSSVASNGGGMGGNIGSLSFSSQTSRLASASSLTSRLFGANCQQAALIGGCDRRLLSSHPADTDTHQHNPNRLSVIPLDGRPQLLDLPTSSTSSQTATKTATTPTTSSGLRIRQLMDKAREHSNSTTPTAGSNSANISPAPLEEGKGELVSVSSSLDTEAAKRAGNGNNEAGNDDGSRRCVAAMSESIERIDQRMSDLCNKLQACERTEQAIGLLKIMIQMIEKAWSVPVCGDDLGFRLCNSLRHAGGLDIILNFVHQAGAISEEENSEEQKQQQQHQQQQRGRVSDSLLSIGSSATTAVVAENRASAPSLQQRRRSEQPAQQHKPPRVLKLNLGANSNNSDNKNSTTRDVPPARESQSSELQLQSEQHPRSTAPLKSELPIAGECQSAPISLASGLGSDFSGAATGSVQNEGNEENSRSHHHHHNSQKQAPSRASVKDNDSDILTSDLGLDSTSVESLSYFSAATTAAPAAAVPNDGQQSETNKELAREEQPPVDDLALSPSSKANGSQEQELIAAEAAGVTPDELEMESVRKEELVLLSARLLSQCLTLENRDYLVKFGLEPVIKLACNFTTMKSVQSKRLLSRSALMRQASTISATTGKQQQQQQAEEHRSLANNAPTVATSGQEEDCELTEQQQQSDMHSSIGTETLQHLFKHSEETCSQMISLGALQAILYGCRSSNVECLRHCASALANLALYGGPDSQQTMIEQKAHVWLFPLAFHEDDNVQYYACLAIVVLAANQEIEADVLKSSTLDLVEPFVTLHEPRKFAESTTAHIHGQSANWLRKLIPLLESKREEARNLACFHFAMEAYIKREQGQTGVFAQIGAIESLRKAASSPYAIAAKFACQALRLIGEREPHKLSQQVPLWTCEDVCQWVGQVGFDNLREAFRESHVDGDLLLQLDEEALKFDIGLDNGIQRRRFLRELSSLKRIADYSSVDKSNLAGLLVQAATTTGPFSGFNTAGANNGHLNMHSQNNISGGGGGGSSIRIAAAAAAVAGVVPSHSQSVVQTGGSSGSSGSGTKSGAGAHTGASHSANLKASRDFLQYIYPLLQLGVTRDNIHLLDCDQLLAECRISNALHRMRLAHSIRQIQERILYEANTLRELHSSCCDEPQKTLDVFVSYRRSTGSQLASLLKVHLQLRGFSVFIDVERLEAGKFDNNLLDSIKTARNFILVLSPNALDRCIGDHDCKDWVHKEIVAALASNCNIIPIIDNFHWPETDQLPEDMRSITYFNGVRWIHDYQDACVDKVERFIRGELSNASSSLPQTATNTSANNNSNTTNTTATTTGCATSTISGPTSAIGSASATCAGSNLSAGGGSCCGASINSTHSGSSQLGASSSASLQRLMGPSPSGISTPSIVATPSMCGSLGREYQTATGQSRHPLELDGSGVHPLMFASTASGGGGSHGSHSSATMPLYIRR